MFFLTILTCSVHWGRQQDTYFPLEWEFSGNISLISFFGNYPVPMENLMLHKICWSVLYAKTSQRQCSHIFLRLILQLPQKLIHISFCQSTPALFFQEFDGLLDPVKFLATRDDGMGKTLVDGIWNSRCCRSCSFCSFSFFITLSSSTFSCLEASVLAAFLPCGRLRAPAPPFTPVIL